MRSSDSTASPFWRPSYGDAMKLYKAEKTALEDKLAKQGIKLLYTVAWPPQGIYANRTLNSVADMKGLKWRAYSPATSRIAELVGAQPVTVQASELTQALATGVVDSYMSSGSTGFDTKTYESIKNFYDTQAWLPKNAVIVNQQAFDALDKATQDAVLKAAADAEVRGWKASEEKNGWYLDQLKQKGMTIVKPTPQLTGDLKKVGDTMLQDWQKKAGPEGQSVVDAYQEDVAADAPGTGRSLHRRRLCGGVVFGRHAGDGAAGHLRPPASFQVRGTDAYAGYFMAGAGFLALAHTLMRGEHIRVTLILEHAGATGKKWLERWSLAVALLLSLAFA